jgi:hypothetical protein
MKDKELEKYCGCLDTHKQRYNLVSRIAYTFYICKLDDNRCVGAKTSDLKLRDNLNLEKIKNCSLRKKLLESIDEVEPKEKAFKS